MLTPMLTHIRTETDLDKALAALTAADPRFAAFIARAGRPPLRRRPDGFAGLAATVVSQQLSTASAGAIWARLAAAFDPLEPQAIMRARPVGSPALASRRRKFARSRRSRGRSRVAGSRSPRSPISTPSGPCGADRYPRNRSVDRRHLSVVVSRPCRCLAGRRSCAAGGGAARIRVAGAPKRQGHARARRNLAAAARSGGARVVDLLSRRQRARGGPQPPKLPAKRGRNGR